jgi:hypothetical protein
MELNSQQIEQVRLSLLRYGMAPGGVSVGLAASYLRSEGFSKISVDQVEAEIDYLCDSQKGFLAPNFNPISPGNRRYSITAKGRDFLAEH